jgi:hypothetical protein
MMRFRLSWCREITYLLLVAAAVTTVWTLAWADSVAIASHHSYYPPPKPDDIQTSSQPPVNNSPIASVAD